MIHLETDDMTETMITLYSFQLCPFAHKQNFVAPASEPGPIRRVLSMRHEGRHLANDPLVVMGPGSEAGTTVLRELRRQFARASASRSSAPLPAA